MDNMIQDDEPRLTVMDNKFSSTEERVFKTCRLAHHFEYDLGYRLKLPNRKLSLGIIFHEGLAAYYQHQGLDEINALVKNLAEKRWAQIVEANPHFPNYAESMANFHADTELVNVMIHGYIEWIESEGRDQKYETVETEVAHFIEVPGAVAGIPVRLDLVQRHKDTGRLRVVDFKTVRSFPTDMTGYMMAEQNGNYQLACLAVFDERPTEMAYRFARKIIPSGRTKPPYFKEQVLHLTKEELRWRLENFKKIAAERFGEHEIYPSPDNCCGSWKNDWQKPCKLVHMGMDPLEALEQSPGYEPNDPYERYKDLEENL